ncbi:MAG: type III toxin-antitoxin system ToxN/AbiQ family toxin [Eubacterium sp.]|nr:type III toxin-antitoxin system ToxN/AbiQ family toxin [Eubacterium sp.]
MRGLKLYEINPKYIKYLAQYQEHIFISDGNKASRKYIGIVLQINEMNYFAPLSSFKPKHKKMKESVDFIKICDYAVININNMVPVPEGEYHLVDVNGTKDMQYRYLMQAESREINRQRNRIIKNADIVYKHKLRNGDTTPLARRTNDFKELEKRCKQY